MDMIVCCKQVLDPEIPAAGFKIDLSTNEVIPPQEGSLVISPFDENAVEAALRLKDRHGGKITIISLGNNLVRSVVKKPLSMGADELVLLEDPLFEHGDSWSTALALSQAIKKIGKYDLIFCGRQAADWDDGQVGLGIAELLGLPSVTLARRVDVSDDKVRVERVLPDGYQVVESALPALITVSNELGTPRYATFKGIMTASKIQPIIWGPGDIGLNPLQVGNAGRKTRLIKLFQPVREGKCEMIEADTPAEAGVKLAERLRESKLF